MRSKLGMGAIIVLTLISTGLFILMGVIFVEAARPNVPGLPAPNLYPEGYAKPSLKKCRPIAARNEDKKVFSGRL